MGRTGGNKHKKWISGGLTAVALLMLSGTLQASGGGILLRINGSPAELPAEAKVEEGQLLVPVRWISAKLGAALHWNEADSSIDLTASGDELHLAQIGRFTDVQTGTTARRLAELWLQGVLARSGSLQYATLSPELQEASRPQFEEQLWGTGGSSPWLEHVVFQSEERLNDNQARFVVHYDLASSNWKWTGGIKEITVERYREEPLESWRITSIKTTFNEFEMFTPAETIEQ